MATNFYFQSGVPGGRTSEQRLVESLITEAIRIYGFDIFYMPRTEVNKDAIFLDDPLATFENAIPLEMYLENVNGYGGDGELMSKFGIEFRDTATFMVVRSRWEDVVGLGRSSALPLPNRPAEGDLLYLPLTKSYFEIKKVEAKDPFFQLGKLYVYRLQCELWQYNSEQINTGVNEIDSLEVTNSMTVSDFQLLLETGGGSLRLDSIDTNATDAGSLLWEGWTLSNQDPLADNENFRAEALAQDYLDFDETNPFGEVIRNNV
jgi:hypothetical protein